MVGVTYTVYIYINETTIKNYDSVVWSRTNLENAPTREGRYTMIGVQCTVYINIYIGNSSKPHDTTKTSVDSVSRWVSVVFTAIRRKSMWERTQLRCIYYCAVADVADEQGTTQLHGWVLRGRVSREALEVGNQITDD